MAKSIIEYRQAVASDVQFIIRSWIDSYKGAHGAGILSIPEFAIPCECGKPIRYDFSAVMEVTLAKLLTRPGLTTWVAHNPRERAPHDLYGYIVSETGANVPTYVPVGDGDFKLVIERSSGPLVHFIFIKRDYRKIGIGRALFKAAGIDPAKPYLYTCRTANIAKLEKAGVVHRDARWFPLSARFDKDPAP
jgi:GNAT superfamily N-acetyltransferase